MDGVPQNQVPDPIAHPPRLILVMDGRVCAILPNTSTLQPATEPEQDSDNEDSDIENQVAALIEKDTAQDSEDGPDWMFEQGELTSPDPNYVFCPAVHRGQLLHLFTKHFCQHPNFFERHGRKNTAELRRQASYDMYKFCKDRGLREVWGYMWASWYCPKMWKLWARSTSPFISRLRTTMGVENFW